MKALFIIGALLVQFCAATVSHEGEQLWRIYASDEKKNEVEVLAERNLLDVWSTHIHHVDILIVPEDAASIEMQLANMGVSHKIMIENIQTLIDENAAIRNNRQKEVLPKAVIDVEIYHTLEEIYAYMNELAVEFDYITIETIGQSFEGRDLMMLKLSTQPNNPNAMWIQCGIHAREWVSPATCIYGLDMLTQNYGTDPEITAFLDDQDVYMVVSVNPDGYVFSWSNNRLWRKNRRTVDGQACIGVDLNRNYDDGISFGGEGSSANPCSETHHGESGFSEPETAAMRDRALLVQQTQNIRTYYDIHSYSQLWLSPYGWTTDLPSDDATIEVASIAAVDAIAALFGTSYIYGPIATTIYLASGGAVDWAYSTGIVYSFTPELRDTGEYGFELPEDQIVPTATELWAGLFAAYNAQQ